jgi:hypothetical protein
MLVFLDNGSHILNYGLEMVNSRKLTAADGGRITGTGERRLSLPPVRPGETGPAKGGTR